jgi:hypothetical protein
MGKARKHTPEQIANCYNIGGMRRTHPRMQESILTQQLTDGPFAPPPHIH